VTTLNLFVPFAMLPLAGVSLTAAGSVVNADVQLARPSAAQYVYHEQERIQFVCLDPCTWQGREYDNHTTDLKDMALPKLDVDQWGARIGSGGRTSDPAKQEAYNNVLRTQWTEVLSRHKDNIIELWFDGSCYVPLGAVEGDNAYLYEPATEADVVVDLSKHITQPGQFLLRFHDIDNVGTSVDAIQLFYDGDPVHEQALSAVKAGEVYLLNRHAQVVAESKIVLKVRLRLKRSSGANIEIAIKPAL